MYKKMCLMHTASLSNGQKNSIHDVTHLAMGSVCGRAICVDNSVVDYDMDRSRHPRRDVVLTQDHDGTRPSSQGIEGSSF